MTLSSRVCCEDDCGQVTRDGYLLCWHHWLWSDVRGHERASWMTLHGLIRWLWDYKILKDYSEGTHDVYIAAERTNWETLDCYHYDIWGGLEELLSDLPDSDNAFYVRGEGMDYCVNDLNLLPKYTVVATLYLDRSSAEEDEDER